MSLCFGKSEVSTSIFFDFFLSKSFLKNVMEYALPEATIGVKWECVWNGIYIPCVLIFSDFLTIY